MKHIQLFEAFVKISDDETAKAEKVAAKVEEWLKSLKIDYKRDTSSFDKNPQFYIYPRLGGCWTFSYDEVRTKRKTEHSSGFYGEYNETGKYAWHMTWPNKRISSSSGKRRRTNFPVFKEVFERALRIEQYFINIINFLQYIGEDTEIKNNVIKYSLPTNDSMTAEYDLPDFNLEVRGEKSKTPEQKFCFWWKSIKQSEDYPLFSNNIKYTDPSKAECLLTAAEIINFDNEKVLKFIEDNKEQPTEKVVAEIKEIMKGRIAAKKFLG